MMYTVLVSRTFQKQFRTLPNGLQNLIRAALGLPAEDPLQPRSALDIKPVKGTKPTKHRLRVGEYRVICLLDKKTVRVIEVFSKGRGYRPTP